MDARERRGTIAADRPREAFPPRRWRALLALPLLLTWLLAWAGPAVAQELQVRIETLRNGMKILVHEDHSIPAVAMYIFYRVGSRNEGPGTTGLSHFFEHMMFNGAKKYGTKQFDVVMETAGGSNNAYTAHDVTVYQDWFPPSALGLIFDMEADRIQHLSFDPKVVESERGVVASERRTSVEGNNYGLLDEGLWATAYMAHPYHWPVIGWMVDIEHWPLDALKRHFAMGYAPGNATMVVAGDVNADEVFRLARQHIEPIPNRSPPPPVTTREPEQMGERRYTLRKFAQLPILMIGYHTPEAASPDFYALQVLDTVLFAGQSSRMYQRIVDKDRLGLYVDSDYDESFDPTLFVITSQPKDGIAPAAVEKAIYEELATVMNKPVSDEELEKAKNILTARLFRSLKTVNGQAALLGRYEVYFGDHGKLRGAASAYARVTKQDLMTVARRYFGEKNRTVATLVPEPEEATK